MAGKSAKGRPKAPHTINTPEDFKLLCKAMDEQHQIFCDHYLVTLNAADSYRKAGYKSKGNSTRANAARLLTNDNVEKYLDYKMKERKKRLAYDEKYILAFLQNITKRRITDYYDVRPDGSLKLKDLTKLPDDKLALIEEIQETINGLKIKLVPITPSLEKLGAHIGMWDKEKQKGSGDGTKYIIRRYIVPAVGNVMIRPKMTPTIAKEIITQHLLDQKNK